MKFVDIHTHNHSFEEDVFSLKNIFSLKDYADSYFSIGVHPWYADKYSISEVEEALEAYPEKCLAIGECGIDLYKSTLTETEQESLFCTHLDLAVKYKRPIILHFVHADHLFCKIIKDYPNITYIWHGFSGNIQLVNQLKKYDVYYCFSMKNAKNKSLWNEMDFRKILCETDDSEVNIKDVYKELSKILSVDENKLKEIVWENSNKSLNYVMGR